MALANPPNPLLVGLVEALFAFPPFFDSATKKVSETLHPRGTHQHILYTHYSLTQSLTHARTPSPSNSPTPQARNMIIQRGAAIGLDWPATLAELQQLDWESRMQQATDPLVGSYPDYYTQPFHAYKQVRCAGLSAAHPV